MGHKKKEVGAHTFPIESTKNFIWELFRGENATRKRDFWGGYHFQKDVSKTAKEL